MWNNSKEAPDNGLNIVKKSYGDWWNGHKKVVGDMWNDAKKNSGDVWNDVKNSKLFIYVEGDAVGGMALEVQCLNVIQHQ